MSTVADLNDSAAWRGPARLRVAPQQLEVDDGVGRRAFDQLLKDRRPFDGAADFVEAGEDFRGGDGVLPGFGGGACCLRMG